MVTLFDKICLLRGIGHRHTKPNHLWTNGQVERMNRTFKEASAQRYHYDLHEQLRVHLKDFVGAYNFASRLKALNELTAYQFICKCWQSKPERFNTNPQDYTFKRNQPFERCPTPQSYQDTI